jgi:hypothetical protein
MTDREAALWKREMAEEKGKKGDAMTTTTKTMTTKGNRTFNLNGHTISVRTIDEARAMWLALRDAEGLGASDCVRGCGEYSEDGKVVAHVSYNGRMWQGAARDWSPVTPEIKP